MADDNNTPQMPAQSAEDEQNDVGFAEPESKSNARDPKGPERGQSLEYPDEGREQSGVSSASQEVMRGLIEDGKAKAVEDEETAADEVLNNPPSTDRATAKQTADETDQQSRPDEVLEEYRRRQEESSEDEKRKAFGVDDDDEEDDVDPVSSEELGLVGDDEDGGLDLSAWKEEQELVREIRGIPVTFREPDENDLITTINENVSGPEDTSTLRKVVALKVCSVNGQPISEDDWEEFTTAIKTQLGGQALHITGIRDFTSAPKAGRTRGRANR